MLYKYLKSRYGEKEPIILNELDIEGMSNVNLRQQIKKLVDSGRLKRYDTGIYFISGSSIFASGTQPSKEKVIEQKYLSDGGVICGYTSGLIFANSIGITSRTPFVYEIVTNKATNDYREILLAGTRVVIRKPKVRVNEDNCRILQFMELLKDIDIFTEPDNQELGYRLFDYMEKNGISLGGMEPYLDSFPDKIYRNMYKTGIIGESV